MTDPQDVQDWLDATGSDYESAAIEYFERIAEEWKVMRDRLLYIASFERASLRDCDINVNELGEEARKTLGMTQEDVMGRKSQSRKEEAMMTDDERAIETLTSIAKVYKVTSNVYDDGSEDAITAVLRRDLPIALGIIDRQAQENAHLNDRMYRLEAELDARMATDGLSKIEEENARLCEIEEAAREFTAARHAMESFLPDDYLKLHWRQFDAQKHLDALLGKGEAK